jgi:hypothetical protein
MTTTPLSVDEWQKAMDIAMAVPDDPKESKKGTKQAPRRRPPFGVVKAALNYGEGSDNWTVLMPPLAVVKTFTEIPPSGPADTNVTSPADKPSAAPVDSWAVRIGKPQSTGTPKISMALNEDDTAAGWSSNIGRPQGTVYNSGSTPTKIWTALPTGTPDPNQNPDGPAVKDTTNKSVRTSLASVEDLYTTLSGNASLPDGSFFIATADDVQNCVDKVKNADQNNPRKDTHPWYNDIKGHIARRASDLGCSDLVPENWNLSMGMAPGTPVPTSV